MTRKITAFKDNFRMLSQAKYSQIAIETSEEIRAINIIRDIADTENTPRLELQRVVYEWSMTRGLRDEDDKPVGHDGTKLVYDPVAILTDIEKHNTPGTKCTFILKDFHKFMESPQVQRKLRDLAASLKYTFNSIVFISPVFKVPVDLQKSITVLDLPLPDAIELREILCDALQNGLSTQINDIKNKISDYPEKAEQLKRGLAWVQTNQKNMIAQEKANGDQIVSAGLGLTCVEFEDVVAKCFTVGNLDIKMIMAEKKQIIKQSGTLEYFETEENAASIGGLKILKKHISGVSKRHSKKAREFGITPEKGALFIGVPGSGKSLTAKAASNETGLPVVRLDIGALFGSLVGQSEDRTRQALKIIDTIAPCILWIDEIEKGMSFGDGTTDSGVGQRIFATLLTWMEEQNGTYVIATCNSHTALRPELMARFPRIFFLDVPTEKELYEIISIHLTKVGRKPENFDLKSIVSVAKGYVGREIRDIIQDALGAAFNEDNPALTTDHLISAFKSAKPPITVQKEKEMKEMREWAENNATNASEKDETNGTRGQKKKGRFETDIGLSDVLNS